MAAGCGGNRFGQLAAGRGRRSASPPASGQPPVARMNRDRAAPAPPWCARRSSALAPPAVRADRVDGVFGNVQGDDRAHRAAAGPPPPASALASRSCLRPIACPGRTSTPPRTHTARGWPALPAEFPVHGHRRRPGRLRPIAGSVQGAVTTRDPPPRPNETIPGRPRALVDFAFPPTRRLQNQRGQACRGRGGQGCPAETAIAADVVVAARPGVTPPGRRKRAHEPSPRRSRHQWATHQRRSAFRGP